MLRIPLRSAGQLGVGVFVAAIVIHTWLAMGLIVPVAVSGSSMAPTLVGPHQDYRCDACRSEFPVGIDQLPLDGMALCPKCGRRAAAAMNSRGRLGDRLIVDRTAYTFRAPRRWEVVVFRSPESAGELVVKRVVGLPGETVSLVDGTVWINGRIVRNPRNTDYEIRAGDRPAEGGNSWRLGPAEFFVLGDNAAISDDSRNWLAGGGLDAKLLVGKPLGVR
jgi:signal peptidase I